ncbi:MAG: alpha-2-macroglobulin family protein, partial [Gammaproteobacteria bacterium]|nr:alpha-2-macroglobulin family protein [Gammaproteobacteria bacterium]
HAAETPLNLPADARDIRLHLSAGAPGLFRQALDELLSYPYGCVEQTASRLLPLSLAMPLMAGAEPRVLDRLRLVLQNSRLRLVHLADADARFGWWGGSQSDAFLTAYAYYADWHATQALGLTLSEEHWMRALSLYAEQADTLPLLHRALVLDFAHTLGLPVKSLLEGLLTAFPDLPPTPEPVIASTQTPASTRVPDAAGVIATGETPALPLAPEPADVRTSLVFEAPDSADGLAAARVLSARLAQTVKVPLPEAFAKALPAAQTHLEAHPNPFLQGVRLHRQRVTAAQAADLLATLAPQQPTLERALILVWLYRSLGDMPANDLNPGAGWVRVTDALSEAVWQWQGEIPPTQLNRPEGVADGIFAQVRYRSADASGATPVTLTRKLWRLIPGEAAFAFSVKAVAPDEPLSSSQLYLDEIVVRTAGTAEDAPLRYGVVEVPLPPGADVERTTWGMQISGLGGAEAAALEKARHEPGQLAYTVPLDAVRGEVRLRHLVRFSQKGDFSLPPARYWRMYAPEQQAWEQDSPWAQVKVE